MKNLQKILEEQFERYKKIQVQDVYKLLYQGVFGPEHFICEKTRQNLYEEFEKAIPEKTIMFERVSPIFEIYRTNIKPYKYYKGTKEELFSLLEESTKIKTGNPNVFKVIWGQFKKINDEKDYFSYEEIEAFEKKYSVPEQLPILHHSKKYRKANKPSYIIINLQKMCEDDN
jgi:hypothetical protein